MFKTLLSALPKLGTPGKSDAPEVTVDLSRVIKELRQPAPEPGPTLQDKPADEARPAPTETLAGLAEEAVDSLSGQFETWMRTDLEHLVEAWDLARQPGATPDRYRAVFTAAHNIKGAANAYGYPAIARLCGSLSRLLTETRPGENAALINLHVEACRAAFSSAEQGSDSQPIAEAVCEALEEQVAGKLAKG